jgi:hypothetical protein
VVALCLALAPLSGPAYSAGLGRLTVQSALGQPLRAEVEGNLRRLEGVLADLQRKWPFAHQPELKLP